jgi:hypothetical protein
MTTPPEEEARAAAEALFPNRPYAVRHFIEGYLAALASRVSTPPSEDARVAGLREAADIADRMYAGTDGSALEKAWIGGCMATASAIRHRVQEIEGVAPVPAVPVLPTEPAETDQTENTNEQEQSNG